MLNNLLNSNAWSITQPKPAHKSAPQAQQGTWNKDETSILLGRPSRRFETQLPEV